MEHVIKTNGNVLNNAGGHNNILAMFGPEKVKAMMGCAGPPPPAPPLSAITASIGAELVFGTSITCHVTHKRRTVMFTTESVL